MKINVHKNNFQSQSLNKQYINKFNIKIDHGEFIVLVGPSGCGKTTLLNCLSGIDDINSGTIHIENTDLSQLDDNSKTDYRARRMGFIFQFYNLLPVLNAIENIELPLLVSGVRPSEAREQSLKMLDLVGLTDWKTHKPAQLSGGQRQRVTIARALVNNPAIVWADEPTGDLDSQTATEIMDLMKSLNKEQGQTFVIVTHDSGIAKQCNRIIHMRDGQIENEEFT